ncbi:MAG: DUF4263 domain-containing protein, partial [Candidatus Electryonea clarkiae]|nr:DUF4263 domain-containing protein [Candidatus Electryonea clarkiae]
MAKESPPSEASLDDVKVRISEAYRNPNIGKIQQVTLKEGPRAFRIATLMEIKDPRTGKLHHYSLKIDSIDRRKNGWFSKPERSIRLEGHDPDEIERLYRFLTAHAEGKLSRTGDLHVIGTEDYEKLEGLLDQIPSLASPDMVELVKLILPRIENAHTYLGEFIQTFEDSDPQTVADIAIASRMVQYKRAHENLVELVQAETLSEPLFQKLLEENPWMFGSEYSELLDRRVWTRDDALDFMLRRTSDDFLEVIEIKTPFSDALLLYDKSHDSYYPSSKLSPVLGQVMRYIEELERSRDSILSKDGLDTLKIRARVIIGRDGDKRCQEALRNL